MANPDHIPTFTFGDTVRQTKQGTNQARPGYLEQVNAGAVGVILDLIEIETGPCWVIGFFELEGKFLAHEQLIDEYYEKIDVTNT